MVRISDLVKGKSPTPASVPRSNDQGERVRLSNLGDLIHRSGTPREEVVEKPPLAAPGQPPQEIIPGPPPEAAAQRPSVSASGEVISEPPPEAAVEKPPAAVPREPAPPILSQTAPPPVDGLTPDGKTLYFTAQAHLQEVRKRLLEGKPISLESPLQIIERMIAEPSAADEMYQLTLAFGCGDDLYVTSPVNSMIYSFKIGKRMGYTPAKLTEISLSALHHDIGMYLIPSAITQREGSLTEAEFALIRRHTETGRDLFASLDFPNVSRAIYEHHERESGQGYPLGLKGEQICEQAKIIGICDSYEAMTHDRPHKKAAAQYLSVLQLAESKDMLFPHYIMKIFLEVITLYPIGSYVRLNNKAVGVVVDTNPRNPLKPTVRIIIDGHGDKITEEKLINLAENNILTIAAGVSAAELPA